MAMGSKQRNCAKCKVELLNPTGVFMGIPFAHYNKVLVCGKCYDTMTVDEHKVQQRTGEEVI
jgi:uncharacterized CHY-type Zn-finger protein